MTDVIQMTEVSKVYSHFEMQNLNLALASGQIMGLVGVNGAGKSTTIRMLMGLIESDRGEVKVLGHRLPEEQALAKKRIGYASEDMRLYKSQTLQWHMDFIASIFPGWDREYANILVKKFGLKADQILKGFSHGQRVKASLLLLLARRPDLLILDEPTTGLDPVARADVIEELTEVLRDENRSVLFSSHNTRDVEQLSDTLTFMHDGNILASEDISHFLESWRMIRCKGTVRDNALNLPGVAEVKQSGSLINLKVGNYSEGLLDQLKSRGLEILEVLNMNLEEIFIANIRRVSNHEI